MKPDRDQQIKNMVFAYHEAGHATIALAYNWPLTSVDILAKGDNRGAVKVDQPSETDDETRMQLAVFLIAPRYATQIGLPSALVGAAEAEDQEFLSGLLRRWSRSFKRRVSLRHEAHETAAGLIIAHQPFVHALAKKLMAEKKLDGPVVQQLFRAE